MDGHPIERLVGGDGDRRRFLARSAAGVAGALALGTLPEDAAEAAVRLGGDPFTLGVASGDPEPGGIVLWTRLAVDPLNGGGMPSRRLPVTWRIARDPKMRQVVRSGTAVAMPDLAHSIHVEVDGLRAGTTYWYQFAYRDDESPIGRFRTAPLGRSRLERLDFAFVTCQRWDQGFYTAYRDIARQDLDLVIHLGDYLYEYDPRQNVRGVALSDRFAGETVSLDRYRDQYALYKSDPDLQAAHAAFAFVTIWDDHEVQNDYADRFSTSNTPVAEFLQRRANAYQAFYEHHPLRRTARPEGADLLLYRRLRFGDLADISFLDTRQYRANQPCGDGESDRCAAALDPDVTLMGRRQERWLSQGLRTSPRQWNVIAQQVLMAELDHDVGPGTRYWNDAWDGYPLARQRLLDEIYRRRIKNPLVLTGDWHSTFVNELKLDFKRERSPVVAPEFVTPGISSDGDFSTYGAYYGPFIPANPHIKYFDGDRRGWFKGRLTRQRFEAELRFVSRLSVPDGTVSTAKRFVVEAGDPRVKEA